MWGRWGIWAQVLPSSPPPPVGSMVPAAACCCSPQSEEGSGASPWARPSGSDKGWEKPPSSSVSGKGSAGFCRVPSMAWGRPEVTELSLGWSGGESGALHAAAALPLLQFPQQRPVCFGSEEQDELHCQDTDSDVPEQRDGRCKVKWTQEEVSESLALAEGRCLGCAAVLLHPSPRSLAAAPAHVVLLLEKAVCPRP